MATTTAVKKRRGWPPSAFRVVEERPELLFGQSNQRTSVYLQALQTLVKAGPGKVLEFDSPGARNSIYQQAKKHNIKLLFAVEGGKLYVRLEDVDGPLPALVAYLKEGPHTIMEIQQHMLRVYGIPTGAITGLLADLSRNNRIELANFGGVKKWKLVKG